MTSHCYNPRAEVLGTTWPHFLATLSPCINSLPLHNMDHPWSYNTLPHTT